MARVRLDGRIGELLWVSFSDRLRGGGPASAVSATQAPRHAWRWATALGFASQGSIWTLAGLPEPGRAVWVVRLGARGRGLTVAVARSTGALVSCETWRVPPGRQARGSAPTRGASSFGAARSS